MVAIHVKVKIKKIKKICQKSSLLYFRDLNWSYKSCWFPAKRSLSTVFLSWRPFRISSRSSDVSGVSSSHQQRLPSWWIRPGTEVHYTIILSPMLPTRNLATKLNTERSAMIQQMWQYTKCDMVDCLLSSAVAKFHLVKMQCLSKLIRDWLGASSDLLYDLKNLGKVDVILNEPAMEAEDRRKRSCVKIKCPKRRELNEGLSEQQLHNKIDLHW